MKSSMTQSIHRTMIIDPSIFQMTIENQFYKQMKKLSIILIFFLGISSAIAQVPGITYQAVILNPEGKPLPGVNNPAVPLADQEICLKFSFVNALGQNEYEEIISTKTDSMVW